MKLDVKVKNDIPEYLKVLKEVRESKNITQKDLAKHLKVSHMAISHYEKGIRGPKISEFEKWLKYLNLEMVIKNKD